MKIIVDRKRIGPLLLMVSLAVVGSIMLMSMASEGTVSAQDQQCVPADHPFAGIIPVCGEETATPTSGDQQCVPEGHPFAGVIPVCPTSTPTPDAAATAQAMADATATAAASATAAADAATAVADAATAVAAAATAAAATATAQAKADMTATAQAKMTATAEANMTRTAVAQATVTSGGVPPPAPKATATPVMAETVEVSGVEGATAVDPDMQVSLMAGNVTVKFPTLSRARSFQAMVSESSDCGDMAMACAMVSIYNAEGEMESDVRLISSAEIEVMLDAATVDELGGDLDGGAVAIQANALGGIMLQLMDAESGEWNSIPSEIGRAHV